MKKRFFYASLLLAAATLNSCSQDSDLVADEAAAAAAGALTPEQRAQIMELAEYYDLDVTIDDRPATRGAGQEFNIDSVEAEFRRVASLKGEYTCVQADLHPRQVCVWLLDDVPGVVELGHRISGQGERRRRGWKLPI